MRGSPTKTGRHQEVKAGVQKRHMNVINIQIYLDGYIHVTSNPFIRLSTIAVYHISFPGFCGSVLGPSWGSLGDLGHHLGSCKHPAGDEIS